MHLFFHQGRGYSASLASGMFAAWLIMAGLYAPHAYAQAQAQALAVSSARIDLGDITLYLEQTGKGQPIIFLHGGLGSAKSWDQQVPVFAQHYRVIMPESRGQGRSTDAKGPLSYHQMAEDIVRLMDALQLPSAHIVGWSDGGNIGLDLAIHHPERIKKLVAYGANIAPSGLQQHFLDYLRSASAEQLQRDNGRDYLALSATPEHLPIIAQKIRQLWLTEPQFSAAQLAQIKTPTLILDGEEEELIRKDHAEEIAAAIPRAQLLRLPHVGHFGTLNSPKQWNAAVLRFLQAP